jgi:hypothetical protein
VKKVDNIIFFFDHHYTNVKGETRAAPEAAIIPYFSPESGRIRPLRAGPGYTLVSFLPAAKKDTASIPCAFQNPAVRGALLRLKLLRLCSVQRPFLGAGRIRYLLG